MEILNELTYIVGRNKVRGIDMKDLYLDQGSKVAKLYHSIIDGKCSSDLDGLNMLYPGEEDTGKYRYVKSQLKKRLLNYLFFIDLELPSFTDRQKAFLSCHKEWAMVNILFGRGARNACVDIAESLLKKAIRFEFHEIVMDVAKILRFHYGVMAGDRHKYQKYKALYDEHERYYINENRIEGLYSEVIFQNFDNQLSKSKLWELIEGVNNEILPLLLETPTYKAQLYGFLIQIMLYSSAFENEAMIETCKKAIHFFKQKPYQANTPLQIFYYQQLIGYTQLRQFDEGRTVAEACLQFLEDGTYNWFKFQESYFILAMHTGQYQEAYMIFETVISNMRFKAMPKDTKEIWKIYEAYLYLVFATESEDALEEKAPKVSKFRLGRFLNEIPTYSKEKRGMNIAILVIQILISIHRKSYDQAIDRMEAIEKYCTRYLRTNETLRSYYFIKMLLAIPANSFHKAAVLRRTKKYEGKIQTLPLEVVDQDYKIEVIPYEQLWEKSISLLESKFVKSRWNKSTSV